MSSRAERSVAKDLESIKQWNTQVDVHEILRRKAPLDDKIEWMKKTGKKKIKTL